MCQDCVDHLGVESVCVPETARDEILDHFHAREWGTVLRLTETVLQVTGHPDLTDEQVRSVVLQVTSAADEVPVPPGTHRRTSPVELLTPVQIASIIDMSVRTAG